LIAARTQQQPATIASPNSPPAGAHNPNSPTMHAINAMSGMNPMEQNQVNMPRAPSPSHAFSGKFNFAQAEIHSDDSDEVDESSGEKALANRDDISDDGKKQLSLPTKVRFFIANPRTRIQISFPIFLTTARYSSN
jgi:hypothetical protein